MTAPGTWQFNHISMSRGLADAFSHLVPPSVECLLDIFHLIMFNPAIFGFVHLYDTTLHSPTWQEVNKRFDPIRS